MPPKGRTIKPIEKIAKRKDLGDKKADVFNLLGFSYRKHKKPDLDKAFNAYTIALNANPKIKTLYDQEKDEFLKKTTEYPLGSALYQFKKNFIRIKIH